MGKEALEKAKSLKPDIMLVDICMPFIDGLELIDMLRQEYGLSIYRDYRL